MHLPARPPARRARGFTLIELLTVIAIIGILAAIIIPTVGKVRDTARTARCTSNLRTVATAVAVYVNENRDTYPESFRSTSGALYFTEIIAPYIVTGISDPTTANRDAHRRRVSEVLRCPGNLRPQVDEGDTRSTYSVNPQLMPDRNAGAYSTVPLTRASAVRRPSQTILAADGGQNGEGAANRTHSSPALHAAIFAAANGGTSLNDPANGDAAHGNLTTGDRDTINGFFRYRHSGETAVNCAMADGSVRLFKKGDIKNRNVSIAY